MLCSALADPSSPVSRLLPLSDAYALMKILSKQYGVYRFKVVANMVRTLKEGQDLFSQFMKWHPVFELNT